MGDTGNIAYYADGISVLADVETYERYKDLRKKCKKPDCEF
tara:strand:+ start:501 stop:623 length:123 start_codon:yes stop_codon:yes gene_type:complete